MAGSKSVLIPENNTQKHQKTFSITALLWPSGSYYEILHYSAEARTGDDVFHILQLIQRAVACPRVIGGVAQLNAGLALRLAIGD